MGSGHAWKVRMHLAPMIAIKAECARAWKPALARMKGDSGDVPSTSAMARSVLDGRLVLLCRGGFRCRV